MANQNNGILLRNLHADENCVIVEGSIREHRRMKFHETVELQQYASPGKEYSILYSDWKISER
jgi:hypothetical protein